MIGPDLFGPKLKINIEMSPITVVWKNNPKDLKHYWETDWLRFLFQNLELEHIIDPNLATYRPNIVLVTSHMTEKELSYFRNITARGGKYGIIWLSDEGLNILDCNLPTDYAFMCRNYYHPKLELLPNLVIFPAGVKQQFWQDYTGPAPNTITNRPLVWSFAGSIHKTDRKELVAKWQQLNQAHKVHTISGWNAGDSLSTVEYRNLLLQSKYVLSPMGNVNLECFRTWEALEAGCIPVVPARVAGNYPKTDVPFYYSQLAKAIGVPEPPFPQVENWQDLPELFTQWQADTTLAKRCYNWWLEVKTKCQFDFTRQFNLLARG